MNNELIDYYSRNNAFTDPGPYRKLFNCLPKSISSLCHIVQGLLIHETDGELFNIVHPPSRFSEMGQRSIQQIMKVVLKHDNAKLTIIRQPSKRKISTCRDFALLLVSMCRHQQIPARMRVGFSPYINNNSEFNIEHTIVEYWNKATISWIKVDPRVSQYHFDQGRILIPFDFLNIPKSLFSYAGQVWLDCINGIKNPEQYGFLGQHIFKGLWYIRNRLMHDFSALNKFEMLPWDAWGYMFHEPPNVNPSDPLQLAEISKLATAFNSDDFTIAALKYFWANPNLKIPSIIVSYDRYSGPNGVELAALPQT